MPLQRTKYHVIVKAGDTEDDYVEHDIEVAYADRLRGELEAAKQGLPPLDQSVAQNHVTVWVWAALVRLGLYGKDCRTFRLQDVLDVEGKDQETIEVPPTQPAPFGEPPSSLAPASAEDPATGSTPT